MKNIYRNQINKLKEIIDNNIMHTRSIMRYNDQIRTYFNKENPLEEINDKISDSIQLLIEDIKRLSDTYSSLIDIYKDKYD